MHNTTRIRLSEHISEEHIIIHSSSENAEAIVREMVHVLLNELGQDICEDIADAIIAKEKVRTTGIGYGVAVPHTRSSLVKQLYCVAATSKKGIEFNTMDKKPAYLFFLVISPEFTVGPHLNMISAISLLIGKNSEINAEFNEAASPSEFMEILKDKEETYIE